MYGWYDSELIQKFMSKKFVEVFPAIAVIFISLLRKMVKRYFNADRISANPSSWNNPILVKSMFL